jgi:inosose dehydratase
MDGAMRLRVATGPVCWGVDHAEVAANPPWRDVVAGIDAAGFRWTELGPLGYLPPEADAELQRRGIGVTAGFVFEPLLDGPRALAATRATAARVAGAGGRFLVIIDAVALGAPRLDREGRWALARTVLAVAKVARDHGLRPVLHPHAGTHVERAGQVEPLLDLCELCLDTGHCAYVGEDPVALYRRWADRIPYLHVKDVDPDRRDGDFWASVAAGVFRPLGEGMVDFAALLAALRDHEFDGWAVVEQDRTPGGDPVADLVTGRRALEALL